MSTQFTAVRRGHIVPTMNSSIRTKGNDNLEGLKIILIIFYHEKNENASTALKVSSGLKWRQIDWNNEFFIFDKIMAIAAKSGWIQIALLSRGISMQDFLQMRKIKLHLKKNNKFQ